MKRATFLAMVWLLGLGVASGEDRPIVAVFDIEAQDVKLPAKTWDKLNNYLASLLAERGFQVVPRAQLKQRLNQQKKDSYKQCYDQACQIEIGRDLAAQKTVAAQLIKLGKNCKVTLTLYDLKKSASEGGATESGDCGEGALVESLEKAVAKLVGGGAPTPGTAPAPAPPKAPGLVWVHSAPANVDFTKSEVTVAQYRACVEAGACSAPGTNPDNGRTCNWGEPNRDTHPVNCLNWNQAGEFCAWVGGRLPSDAEWVAEASDGGKRKYPWGDQAPSCDLAITMLDQPGCGRQMTWPVCSKPVGNSVSGLCDMAGNVSEWTASPMPGNPNVRLMRGGAWDFDQKSLANSESMGWGPGDDSLNFGIRCARPVQ